MSPASADAPAPGTAQIPQGLVSAVVALVDTGPVPLGGYTIAELTAVDAIVDFLEARPSDEVIAEAVRSLAARQLLVAGSEDGRVQVRGDLGIAVAFQQRARMVLDARATGTALGEPWRMLLLPQPEPICLTVRIDALGIHELGLFRSAQALDLLTDWLPSGEHASARQRESPDDLIAAADRSALITVTRYTISGSAEIAGASSDLVLARRGDSLHAFARHSDDQSSLAQTLRNGGDQSSLAPTRLAGDGVRDTVEAMLS